MVNDPPCLNADWNALFSIVVMVSGKVNTRDSVSWNALCPIVVSCVHSDRFSITTFLHPQNMLLEIFVMPVGNVTLSKAEQPVNIEGPKLGFAFSRLAICNLVLPLNISDELERSIGWLNLTYTKYD